MPPSGSTCITHNPDTHDGSVRAPRYHELSPGSVLGPYVVGREIGRGSHGVVYHAFDRAQQREVALKSVVSRTAAKGGKSEADLLMSVSSAHVVRLFDLLEQPPATILVLELVSGLTLDQIIRHGTLQPAEVAVLGAQLATGLEALHASAIVHGDIKPSNLKLSESGVLKILDLGISRRVEPDGQGHVSQEAGVIVGTVPYMPPEQFLGGAADVRSDIWSAGAVLFEIATGRRAYDVLPASAHLHGLTDARAFDLGWFGDGSPALSAAIWKAMHAVPARRFQTAEEMRRAFTAIVSFGDRVPIPISVARERADVCL